MQVSEYFAKIVRGALIAVFVIMAALLVSDNSRVRAQGSGFVGIQAQMIPVFTAQTTTTHSAIFNDIGQGSNLLFFCTTNFTGTIDLEWAPPPITTYYVITQASYTADTGCHSLPFGSYFPNLRSTVTINPSSGPVSAWYTAISGPVSFAGPAIGTNGPTSPIACDQNPAAISLLTGTSNLIASPKNAGDSVIICSMVVSFSAAPSGNIQIQWGSGNCAGLAAASFYSYVSTASPNPIVIPMQQRGAVGFEPCFFNNSGATAEVSLSYASVHIP